MKLEEKIYGGLATVFHGSYSNYDMFYRERFKPGLGAGSMYGDGIYTVYETDMLSNTVKGSYGPTIIKMVASTYKVINFNTLYRVFSEVLYENDVKIGKALEVVLDSKHKSIYRNMLSEPASHSEIEDFMEQSEIKKPIFDLYTGLETLFLEPLTKMGFDRKFYNTFVVWLNKIGWFWFTKTFYYSYIRASALYTARIAKPFADDFYDYLCGNGTKELINGIIFRGSNDGHVMVIYNLNNYIPLAHYDRDEDLSNTPLDETKWKSIPKEKQSEFLKEQKQFFSKHRFGMSKTINSDKQSNDEKIMYYAFQKFIDIKMKKQNNPTDNINTSYLPFLIFLKKSGRDMFDMRNFIDKIYGSDLGDPNNIYKDIPEYDLRLVDDFINLLDYKSVEYYFNNFDTALDFSVEYLSIIPRRNFAYFYLAIVKHNILKRYVEKLKSNSTDPMLNLFLYILSYDNINYIQKMDNKREVEEILMIMMKYLDSKYYGNIHSSALTHKSSFYPKHFLIMIKEKNIILPVDLISLVSELNTRDLTDLVFTGNINLEDELYTKDYDNDEIARLIYMLKLVVGQTIKQFAVDHSIYLPQPNSFYILTKKIILPCIDFLLKHEPEEVHKYSKDINSNYQNILDSYIITILYFIKNDNNLTEENVFTIDSFIHVLNKQNLYISTSTIAHILEDMFVNTYSSQYSSMHVSILLPTVTNALSQYPDRYKDIVDYYLSFEDSIFSKLHPQYAVSIVKILQPDDSWEYTKYTQEIRVVQNHIWGILNSDKSKYQRIFDELNKIKSDVDVDEDTELEENNNYFYL